VHTFLAWQEEPGRPMGESITRRYFQIDAPEALNFVEWIRRLLNSIKIHVSNSYITITFAARNLLLLNLQEFYQSNKGNKCKTSSKSKKSNNLAFYQLEKFIYRHDISSDVRSGILFFELEERRDNA
jgi:hypothetical protein